MDFLKKKVKGFNPTNLLSQLQGATRGELSKKFVGSAYCIVVPKNQENDLEHYRTVFADKSDGGDDERYQVYLS